MIRKFTFIIAVCLFKAGVLLGGTQDNDSLSMSAAWIRQAPPTTDVQAAYLTLKNTGTNLISIVSISSPAFDAIEIHRTRTINGITRMEPVNNLTIAPGSEVRLEPGGMHLMLFKPKRALLEGEEIKLFFDTGDGDYHSITATVRRSAAN